MLQFSKGNYKSFLQTSSTNDELVDVGIPQQCRRLNLRGERYLVSDGVIATAYYY